MTATPDFPRRAEHVVGRRVEETFVLLNVQSGAYYTLDEIGGRIWELCDGSRSAGDIATLLAADYDAPRAAIESDVLELVAELRREAMLDQPS